MQLDDGATDKFIRATVTDSSGNSVTGSPVTLSHDQLGLYQDSSLSMPDDPQVTATYEIFDDTAMSMLSSEYGGYYLDVFPLQAAVTVDNTSIAQAVWDITISAHTSTGSTGERLYLNELKSEADTRQSALITEHSTTQAAIASAESNLISEHSTTQAAIASAESNLLVEHSTTQAAIAGLNNIAAGDVWDVTLSAHTSTGSTGEALAQASASTLAASTVADAVWNATITNYTITGSTGFKLNSLNTFQDAVEGFVDDTGTAFSVVEDTGTVIGVINDQ